MNALPPALAALAAYPQFILYRLVPRADGKTDKLPVHPATLHVTSAHDPAAWVPAEIAIAAAARHGLGVGFVFTAADPFWFVDLDSCLVTSADPAAPPAWNAESVAICQALAGAAVEVSQSGRGLHIIGSGAVPALRSIAKPGRPALFTEGRFVALTGTHATGDAGRDLSAVMPAVVARWFPPGDVATVPADWTDGPCATWRGPADDDALIAKMLASTSAAGSFGGRASLRQIWEADADALARAFPGNAGQSYDASAADAALAQHLAFWTGADCERIQRLMERSALVRGKWEREDYLRRTIIRACGMQTAVLGDRAAPATVAAASASPAPVQPDAPWVGTLLAASDLPAHFAGCVYIEDRYAAAVPDGSVLEPRQFKATGRYGGHRFMLDDTSRPTRNAWEAFAESGTFRPPFAHSICFRPELPARSLIEDSGRVLFNSYVPITVRAVEGDAGPFLRHVAKLLPSAHDQALLLAYMAALVQYPGVKFQWCPIVQGCEGNGKTVLISALVYAVGERYSHLPNAADLSNKFNSWLDQKLFIGVEELKTKERDDLIEALKTMITSLRLEFQAKGGNQITGDNRANFLACTNYKDAMPKSRDGRRYAPLFTAQQEASDLIRDGMGGRYFPDLYAWLRADGFAIVTHFLRSYAIPDALNPATDCHRAPETSSTAEAVTASLGPVEQAIVECAAQGDIGFQGGWVSSTYLAAMLDARKLRGRAPPNTWDSILRSLGYVRHPALAGGRVNNAVLPDGKKSRLWIREGSIAALNITSGAQAAHAYSVANGGLGAVAVA